MKKEVTPKCQTCQQPVHLDDEGWRHDEPTEGHDAKGPVFRHSYPQPVTLSRLNARISRRLGRD